MDNMVKFLFGTQAEYDSVAVKDASTLYFTSDTHRIYKGTILFGTVNIEDLEQKEKIKINGGNAIEMVGA